jgi:hypothetical protein
MGPGDSSVGGSKLERLEQVPRSATRPPVADTLLRKPAGEPMTIKENEGRLASCSAVLYRLQQTLSHLHSVKKLQIYMGWARKEHGVAAAIAIAIAVGATFPFWHSSKNASVEQFICPTLPSEHSIHLMIYDDAQPTAILELTSDAASTNTHCVEVFRNGAFAPILQGRSSSYCSHIYPNEKVHQLVQISESQVNASANSASGGEIGFVLDRETGKIRFHDGHAPLACHRPRS